MSLLIATLLLAPQSPLNKLSVPRQQFVDEYGTYSFQHGDILVMEDDIEALGVGAVPLWPNGLIPYYFEADVDGFEQTAMLSGMAWWESVANVAFEPVQDHAQAHANGSPHIHIRGSLPAEPPNFSGVGVGTYPIGIESWTNGIILHELGHTLGFKHEHQRPDRNIFVSIHTENIGSYPDAFDIEPMWTYGPYDYDSIMHYEACSFSRCTTCECSSSGCITIEPLDPNVEACSIGGNSLSQMDARIASFVYPEPGWRFLDGDYSGFNDGTVGFPFTTLSVACAQTPSGGTLWIKTGSYPAVGTYSRPMTLRASLEEVLLR